MKTPIKELRTTFASSQVAEEIARQLVGERLVACAQIDGPIQSVYRWQGELCVTGEWRCTMKSTALALPRLLRRLQDLHPYEVPEILVSDVDDCSESYGDWLREQIDE